MVLSTFRYVECLANFASLNDSPKDPFTQEPYGLSGHCLSVSALLLLGPIAVLFLLFPTPFLDRSLL
jgi:hypothetical protein